jgi:hypothetical protein
MRSTSKNSLKSLSVSSTRSKKWKRKEFTYQNNNLIIMNNEDKLVANNKYLKNVLKIDD